MNDANYCKRFAQSARPYCKGCMGTFNIFAESVADMSNTFKKYVSMHRF